MAKTVLKAVAAITLDDVEFYLSYLGPHFEQGTEEGSNSIKRLEALRDAMKKEVE